jgi:hypothetical protein
MMPFETVGLYFLDSLFLDIDSLNTYAGVHSIHFHSYYRLLTKKIHTLFTIV